MTLVKYQSRSRTIGPPIEKLRYDHAYSWSPAEHNGTTSTSRWNAQPITFPRTVSVRGFDDITPRLGAAYDVFGTGRTAVKVNVGKYLDAATNDSSYTVNNPANRIQQTLTRSWTDNDNDRVVDCNILDPGSRSPTATGSVDTCGALGGNSARFENVQDGLTQVNPATLGGWGVRRYDWQVGVAVQQEVLPPMSVEVAYNRRWFGNFTVTGNRSLVPADYETWIATAPVDAPLAWRRRLQHHPLYRPAGVVRPRGPELCDVRGGLRSGADQLLARRRGDGTGADAQRPDVSGRNEHWPREDRCETVVRIDSPDPRNCRTVAPFRTTFRGSASYTLPKLDVLVSSIVRIQPPPAIIANYNFPNSIVLAQLGHLPENQGKRGKGKGERGKGKGERDPPSPFPLPPSPIIPQSQGSP